MTKDEEIMKLKSECSINRDFTEYLFKITSSLSNRLEKLEIINKVRPDPNLSMAEWNKEKLKENV